jgi:ABC-type glycerol-3-phosphate transport system substrate-binding protein
MKTATVATFPTFTNASQIGGVLDSHFFQLATTSTHPKEAFQVIQYLTSNPTIQAYLAASGKVPAVLDQQVVHRYGANLNSLPDDPNWSILFESDFKQVRTPRFFDNMLNQTLAQAFNKIIRDGMDVNQAINELQEVATHIIQDNSHLLK